MSFALPRLARVLLATTALSLGTTTAALADDDIDSGVAACLQAWGSHPFGKKPGYRVLSTSVKVFGIGQASGDYEKTASPSLVVVNPGVNVMGGSEIELLNPNGWYCLRTTVNVMGGLTIRLACNAQIAMSSGGTTVMGNNAEQKGVTVMGSTTVERVGCPEDGRT